MSTKVDGLQKAGALVNPDEPWWANNPDIEAIRRGVDDWLEEIEKRPVLEGKSDPMWEDVQSGASKRRLIDARDELDEARVRYREAIRAARTLGWSWGEMAALLCVSRQALHRRFRDEVD
jgi:DNA-directed RNA polymerase specialized sigma24 family protein